MLIYWGLVWYPCKGDLSTAFNHVFRCSSVYLQIFIERLYVPETVLALSIQWWAKADTLLRGRPAVIDNQRNRWRSELWQACWGRGAGLRRAQTRQGGKAFLSEVHVLSSKGWVRGNQAKKGEKLSRRGNCYARPWGERTWRMREERALDWTKVGPHGPQGCGEAFYLKCIS